MWICSAVLGADSPGLLRSPEKPCPGNMYSEYSVLRTTYALTKSGRPKACSENVPRALPVMDYVTYLIADKGAGPIEPMVITPNRFPFLSENGMEGFRQPSVPFIYGSSI